MYASSASGARNGTAGSRLARRIALIFLAALAIPGCAGRRQSQVPAASQAESSPSQGSADLSSSGPEPSVSISYGSKDDSLQSLTVMKFTSAQVLRTRPRDAANTASIIRLGGGMAIWQVNAQRGLLGFVGKQTPAKVTYGTVPNRFEQIIPEDGSPEPLEPNRYYVFTLRRNSGAIGLELLKVDSGGTLERYAAEPRIGSSYEVCCNLPADFTSAPPEETGAPPEQPAFPPGEPEGSSENPQ